MKPPELKPLEDSAEIKNDSVYIGFIDLLGKGNVKVTISNVEDASGVKIDGVREAKPLTYAITFNEVPNRRMLIQGRKKKFLIRTFGKKKSDWVGKSVEIYADATVKFGGKEVGGVKFVGQE